MVDRVQLESADARSRATSIKKLVRSMELRLQGYVWDSKGDDFVYTGSPMCGQTVIAKATGLLQPFCEEANLITQKSKEMFSKQKWEINTTLNRTLLTERACPADNYTVIMKMFKTTLQNIGDIILSSKGFMHDMFAGADNDNSVRTQFD